MFAIKGKKGKKWATHAFIIRPKSEKGGERKKEANAVSYRGWAFRKRGK